MRKIFINDFGRLRSGWRVLLFVFAFLAAMFLLATALRIAYAIVVAVSPAPPGSNVVADFIFRITLLAAALIAGYLCARLFEGLPWRSLGLTLHSGWLRDLIIGSAIGIATLVVAVAIAMIGGGLRFSFSDAGATSIGRSMLGSAV